MTTSLYYTIVLSSCKTPSWLTSHHHITKLPQRDVVEIAQSNTMPSLICHPLIGLLFLPQSYENHSQPHLTRRIGDFDGDI